MFLIRCAGFGSGTVNFLHNSYYRAMLIFFTIAIMGLFVLKTASLIQGFFFLLLMSSAYTEPRPCLLTLAQQ